MNPNDAAFPNTFENDGLTKREYFAAKAMQGLLAFDPLKTAARLATESVELADALISALNQGQP